MCSFHTLRFVAKTIVLLGVLWGFGANLQARDDKELRKYYTKALRLHIYNVDRALLEADEASQLSSVRLVKLSNDFEALKLKLSPAKQIDFKEKLTGLSNAKGAQLIEQLLEYRRWVLTSFRVIDIPNQNPNLTEAQIVYRRQCAACHGATGLSDGKLAMNKRFPMNPPPTNLKKLAEKGLWTPFSYYNLLLTGVPGTSMQAYDVDMTDSERWSLAFYLSAYPFSEPNKSTWDAEELWAKGQSEQRGEWQKALGSLDILAEKSDYELKKTLQVPEGNHPRSGVNGDSEVVFLRRTLPFLSNAPRKR